MIIESLIIGFCIIVSAFFVILSILKLADHVDSLSCSLSGIRHQIQALRQPESRGNED